MNTRSCPNPWLAKDRNIKLKTNFPAGTILNDHLGAKDVAPNKTWIMTEYRIQVTTIWVISSFKDS